MERAEHRGGVPRSFDRAAHRGEGSHLLQRPDQEVGAEERILPRQLLDGLIDASSRTRRGGEDRDPRREVTEDGGMVEAKTREGAPLRQQPRQRLAGAEGDAIGDAPLERQRGARQPDDRAGLRELVQDVEVLRGVLPRKAAHPGVCAGAHGDAASHGLVGVGRSGPGEAQGVVTQGDLIEAAGEAELLLVAEPVLEEVQGRGVPCRLDGRGLVEVVVGQERVGVGVVEPRRGEAPRGVEGQGEIVADLSREADALALRKIVAGPRAVHQRHAAVGIIENGRGMRPGDLPGGGRGAEEARTRGLVGEVLVRRRVFPRVQHHDHEGLPAGAAGHGAQRVEEALALPVRGDDEGVGEVARHRVGGRRLGLRMARQVLRDGLVGRPCVNPGHPFHP